MDKFSVCDIREEFSKLLYTNKFTKVGREASMTNLVGNSTIEIVGANFIANEDSIFGKVNWDYVKREEEWYNSQSLNVNDIPFGPPEIWKAVADKDGFINSNYGWAIYSCENGFTMNPHEAVASGATSRLLSLTPSQYDSCLQELRTNPESRRANMIYTRPSMWVDYNKNGRSDFMCTNNVQYLIRDGELHALVYMRSNDAIFGYKNDRAWQQHVLNKLAADLDVPPGKLYWNVSSLHVYAKHYYLVDHYTRTGEITITKSKYEQLYPDSVYI